MPTYEEDAAQQRPQHIGLGRRLVARAEHVAWDGGARRTAIISGVGVRRYYEKLGYRLEGAGCYMVKDLSPETVSLSLSLSISRALSLSLSRSPLSLYVCMYTYSYARTHTQHTHQLLESNEEVKEARSKSDVAAAMLAREAKNSQKSSISDFLQEIS